MSKLDLIVESKEYVRDVVPKVLPDAVTSRIQHAYVAGFASCYAEWNHVATEPNQEQAEAMLSGMGDELLRALAWCAAFYNQDGGS